MTKRKRDPDEAEIKAATKQIRRGWTKVERRSRIVFDNLKYIRLGLLSYMLAALEFNHKKKYRYPHQRRAAISEVKQAVEWFESTGRKAPFDMESICTEYDLDPVQVRRKAWETIGDERLGWLRKQA